MSLLLLVSLDDPILSSRSSLHPIILSSPLLPDPILSLSPPIPSTYPLLSPPPILLSPPPIPSSYPPPPIPLPILSKSQEGLLPSSSVYSPFYTFPLIKLTISSNQRTTPLSYSPTLLLSTSRMFLIPPISNHLSY